MSIRFLEKIGLKMIILGALMMLVFSGYGMADEGDTLWTRVYDDGRGQGVYSVEQTSDGGFIAAGYSTGYDTADFLLLKTDSNGDTLWTHRYGTSDNEHAESVKQTHDGGYIMAGWLSFYDTFLYYNIYVVRTDADGDTIWTWKYAGELYAYAYDVEETPDNGYVIVGKTGGPDFDDYDAYLIKLDANGGIVWTRVYGDNTTQEGFDVELTSDGGYVITGLTGNCPNKDVILIKVDANGDSLWGHTWGGNLGEAGYSVKATSDGGYIIAGYSESYTPGNPQAYFIKTDSNGGTLWTRIYGGPLDDYAYSICETYSGNYAAVGFSVLSLPPNLNMDFYFLKLDPSNGDTLWTRLYGVDYALEVGHSVIQVTDGSFLVAGRVEHSGSYRNKVYLVNIAGPVLYGSIAGYVSDEIERAPIESVHVSANQYETWTDQYGYYNLSDVLAANYDVSFSHPDYQDTTVTGVTVTVGNTTSLDVQMTAASGCEYVVGDANGSDSYNGLDITFGVAFFKGGGDPMCPYGSCPIPPCDAFFYCGDVNGSCNYNGLDITYGVAYFKGGPSPVPCADCPPTETIAVSAPISKMR